MLRNIDLNNLYKYSLALTHNDSVAYDLVHDVIIKMSGRIILNKNSYARKSIRNAYFDYIKKQNRERNNESKESLLNKGELDYSMEDLYISKDKIDKTLASLMPGDRELLFMLFVEEFTYKEASAKLKINLGTLLSKIHRIKKKIISQENSSEN